eukprot:CAMPEP_0175685140 /NCGR_PEP_ID=MMETSP0097-20121207/27203_1 /TAXON_ID=311494 /ORGANISM="Alexandrium monilatum, Strain CCMP3105" /LENGTH=134 /DNA_ID=CAMNT_0016992099 /DNA_START=371 /DNA_END=775 /DNA_ORIENTATION=-
MASVCGEVAAHVAAAMLLERDNLGFDKLKLPHGVAIVEIVHECPAGATVATARAVASMRGEVATLVKTVVLPELHDVLRSDGRLTLKLPQAVMIVLLVHECPAGRTIALAFAVVRMRGEVAALVKAGVFFKPDD